MNAYDSFLPPGDYLCYLRKSRADLELEARGEEDTLSRHRRILADYALAHHLTVGATYEEVVSGDSIAERPEMQKLLREVETGRWAGVLVMEVERLARGDSIDQGVVARAFKYSNTLIVTPSKVFDPTREYDEEAFEFSLFMARREYKTICRRMHTGMLAAKREGRYIGNLTPYGYERYKLRGRGWSLRPLPAEAEVVRMVYDLYMSGVGGLKIADRLNELQIPPRRAEKWSLPTILCMLQNPHYAGYIPSPRRPDQKKVVDGKVVISRPRVKDVELYEGLHEPIIDRELWHAAQRRRIEVAASRAPRATVKFGLHNPLVQLIRCDCCGKYLQRRAATGRSNIPMYLCQTRGCPTVGSTCDTLEHLVIDALRKFLASISLGKNPPSFDTKKEQQALAEIDKKLAALDTRAARAYEFFEDGTYTREEFRARQAVFQADREELLKTRVSLQSTIDRAEKELAARESLAPNIAHLLEVYDFDAPAPERHALLCSVVESIDYHKRTKLTTNPNSKSDLTLTIHPRLAP